MSNDSLGDRMKNYENSFRQYLPIRMPVVLRVDGSHFHTYTKKCKRPVDNGLIECMNDTAIYLCKNIQGAQIAYVQSDEISILINNYKTLDSQPWFENNLQKMVSVSASMAGAIFTMNSYKIWGHGIIHEPIIKPAFFDSRAWVIPESDVCNAFLWRQQDCTRNSVQMLARTLYSHKQLDGKSNSELQELCFQKGINWNDCPTSQKRGRCIVKKTIIKMSCGSNPKANYGETIRNVWDVDNEIPIFSQDRDYINKYLCIKES
jgi:tRNA(His) guanylyltransferase